MTNDRKKPDEVPEQKEKPETAEKLEGRLKKIVSRRDERGVPYPGDFPNPLGDKNRGCF